MVFARGITQSGIQAKAIARKQLSDWGLDYFDLFLIHFPISLQYVDPNHRYPPEWFGDDGKVHLRKLLIVVDLIHDRLLNCREHPYP
jgi:diketogulonate reductase-like aldo/keto reductase